MKWFRHDSHCSKDAKLDKVLMKYGAEGYGLYWYCIEIIAGEVSSDNLTFEMEHDAEILAYRLKLDSLKVNEMMKYFVSLGLFEINPESKRIVCMALAKRTDEYTSKNPEIAKIQNRLNKQQCLPTPSGQNREVSDHITLHDTTLQDKEDIYTHWNSKNKTIKHKALTDKTKRAISSSIKDYSISDIKKSIDNYDSVLADPEKFYFTHLWTLKDFLTRGAEKFMDSASPLTNFLKDKSRVSPSEPPKRFLTREELERMKNG